MMYVIFHTDHWYFTLLREHPVPQGCSTTAMSLTDWEPGKQRYAREADQKLGFKQESVGYTRYGTNNAKGRAGDEIL